MAYEAPETVIEPYEPNVTALLDPDKLKWRELVDIGTPVPTPWPKEAYDKHSIATQKVRTQMRKDDVPESEMNALFRSNQETVELMFSKAVFENSVGAFEGANYQSSGMYRSELNCLMFTRTTRFCKVCSNAIEQIIDEYSR